MLSACVDADAEPRFPISHAGGYGNLSAEPMIPLDLGAKSQIGGGACTNFATAISVGRLLNVKVRV